MEESDDFFMQGVRVMQVFCISMKPSTSGVSKYSILSSCPTDVVEGAIYI